MGFPGITTEDIERHLIISKILIGNLSLDFVPYTGATKNIDFGSKTLTTTGLGTFGNLTVDNININGATITSDTGTIDFSNENLTTTGIGTFGQVYTSNIVSSGTLTITGNVIPLGTNSLGSVTYPWYNGYFSSYAYVGSGGSILTISGGNVSSSSGALSFSSNNLTTGGNIYQNVDSKKHYFGAANDAYIEFTGSILDIVGNAVTSTDDIRLNGQAIYFNPPTNSDVFLYFNGTTNTGLLKWQEDEDYFQFNDDVWFVESIGIGLTPTPATSAIRSRLMTSIVGSNLTALSSQLLYGTSSSTTFANGAYAGYFDLNVPSTYSGNVTGTLIGVKGVFNNYGTGTIDEGYGLQFQINNRSTGVITTAATIHAQVINNLGAGSVTTGYGLLLDENVNCGTNWQIYSVAGNNYFGNGTHNFIGTIQINSVSGWSGTFTNGDGATVTVDSGIITNVA